MVAQWLALLPHSKKVVSLIPGLSGVTLDVLHVSALVLSWFYGVCWVLWFPPAVWIHAFEGSWKLWSCVRSRTNGWLSPCSPAMSRGPVHPALAQWQPGWVTADPLYPRFRKVEVKVTEKNIINPHRKPQVLIGHQQPSTFFAPSLMWDFPKIIIILNPLSAHL